MPLAAQLVAALLEDAGQATVDACTLNNALNIAQLVGIAVVLRVLRRELVS